MHDVSQRAAALIAAVGLVVTLVGVGIGVGGGIGPDFGLTPDPAAAIAEAGAGFRIAIGGWFLVIVGDVVRAWALYVFLKRVNASVAVLAAWAMLLHDALTGVGVAGLLMSSDLVGGTGVFATQAPMELLPLLVGLFHYGFTVGLLCFSGHLLLNGLLVLRADGIPKVFGVLLLVAFVGYLLDGGSRLLLADPPAAIPMVVALPNTIGELAIVVWMAFRGGVARPG